MNQPSNRTQKKSGNIHQPIDCIFLVVFNLHDQVYQLFDGYTNYSNCIRETSTYQLFYDVGEWIPFRPNHGPQVCEVVTRGQVALLCATGRCEHQRLEWTTVVNCILYMEIS